MTISDYRGASSARLKAARRLTKRALRQRERAFLAEGPQAVSEALATGARVTGLFVTAPAQARHAGLVAQAADAGIDVHIIARREGRKRWNYLNAAPFKDIYDRWISTYAQDAVELLARLKRDLEADPA